MIISRTPYRVSFFGGGTDYPAWFEHFGKGSVISTTIDKYCYLSCRYMPPFFENKSRVVWSKIELVNHPNEIEHPTVRETLKFLKLEDGVEIHHSGDLPARSGMGSSSSFVVGLLHALKTLKGQPIDKKQLALDAIHIEYGRAQKNVGCQDHVAAVYGGFNRINFGGPDKIVVNPIAISADTKKFLQDRLLMYFVGLSRDASEIAGEQIRVTPQKEKELRTMLSFVDEGEKLLVGSTANIDDFGRLLHENWMLKKSLTKVISNSEIDEVYAKAREAGVLGGKLLGAGGGGFMLFYVKPEDKQKVKDKLSGLLNIPFSFESGGSEIIYKGGQIL